MGCGSLAQNPFDCDFAWGTNDPGGSLASYGYLQFMSKWVGYEVTADGTLPRCDGCSWLTQQVASTELVPAYYAYTEFFTKRNIGYGATIATVLTILVVIVSIIFIRVQNSLERKERAGL